MSLPTFHRAQHICLLENRQRPSQGEEPGNHIYKSGHLGIAIIIAFDVNVSGIQVQDCEHVPLSRTTSLFPKRAPPIHSLVLRRVAKPGTEDWGKEGGRFISGVPAWNDEVMVSGMQLSEDSHAFCAGYSLGFFGESLCYLTTIVHIFNF